MFEYASIFHMLIPSSDHQRILVQLDQDHVAHFPKIVTQDHVPSWSSHSSHAAKAIKAEIDCDVYLRRALWSRTINDDDDVISREEALVIVDCFVGHGPSEGQWKMPPALAQTTVWISEEEAHNANWVDIHHNADIHVILCRYFDEIAGRVSVPSQRQRWRLPKWYVKTMRAVDELLLGKGLIRVGVLKQKCNSFQSTVLFCKVEDKDQKYNGVIFVKSTVSLFPEAEATKMISTCLPFALPEFIASKDALFLQWSTKLQCSESNDSSFLRALARMQLESIRHIDTLSSIVPHRGPLWILEQMDTLFSRECILMHSSSTLDSFKDCYHEFARHCHLLNKVGIPLTLVHGDLDPSNVFFEEATAECDASVRFIDWASCCVGHPFYDFVRITRTQGLDNVRNGAAIRSYLEEWLKFGVDMDQIESAARAACPVMMVWKLVEICDLWECSCEAQDRNYLTKAISSSISGIVKSLRIRESSSVST